MHAHVYRAARRVSVPAGSVARVSESASEEHLRVSASSGLGRIALNRPRAINAATPDMIAGVRAALEGWQHDPDIELVLITGEGERGFCAGADVRRLHEAIAAGDTAGADGFFRTEYTTNALISDFGKPVIAVMHGVTMGGGIGLSAHANVRVVTEHSQLAMPETRIGFTPDAGGSFLLSRAPGRLGEFLALTSASMNAADALACGFADFLVPAAHVRDVVHAFETRADPATPGELVMLFDETPEPSPLLAERAWIDEAFSADTVEEIIERLRGAEGDGPARALEALEARPPLALKVTLRAVRRARELPDLRAVLEQEYALVSWFVRTQPDLPEGIRAQVVDKDFAPRWNPAALADVPDALVDEAFAFRPETGLFA